MAKDEAIQNQKVFVRMDAVLELQRYYTFVVRNVKNTEGRDGSDRVRQHAMGRKEAIEKTIQILELPIT